MANAFFSDLLSTISERSRTLLRRGEPADGKHDATELLELCEALLSGRGEASGTAMAREVLDRYHDLDAAGRLTFFETLARDFGPDREKLSQAIESWRSQPNDSDASDLHFASEPQRQELIRRLNRAPGGTSSAPASPIARQLATSSSWISWASWSSRSLIFAASASCAK